MKLLICSQQPDIVRLLQIMFEHEGWEVTICQTESEASDHVMLDTITPQAVLIDPWQDGQHEYLKHVMNIFWEYHVVVAFMTNRVTPEEIQELEYYKPHFVINLLGLFDLTLPSIIDDLVELESISAQSA